MGLYSVIVVFATTLLVYVESSSATTTSKMTEPVYPVNFQLFTENQHRGVHKRFLRTYESPENDIEDRVNIGAIMDGIKQSTKEYGQLSAWLLNGVEALNKLKLGNNIDAALKNSKLDTLFKYTKIFNVGKRPSEQISVVGSLMTNYGDDAVMKALASAKHVDGTKDVATKLEKELLNGWMQKKESVDNVFSNLKIRGEESAVVNFQKMKILDNYITLFNREKGTDESLAKVLLNGFHDDKKLLSILGVAKQDLLTMTKAKELETAVLRQKLNKYLTGGLDSVMSSNHLRRLDRYVSEFSTKYKDNDVSLIGELVAKYGDRSIAKALAEAKGIEGSKDIAAKLQAQQFEAWLKDEKSVKGVNELLHLNRYGDVAITSRGVGALEDYVTFSTIRGLLMIHSSGR